MRTRQRGGKGNYERQMSGREAKAERGIETKRLRETERLVLRDGKS